MIDDDDEKQRCLRVCSDKDSQGPILQPVSQDR